MKDLEDHYHDDFISEVVDILVDRLKGLDYDKGYETVRRVNYLVNIAKQDDLKKSLNRLKSFWRMKRQDWKRYL